jgi:8-oxo-dGTP pyrophosphatase MutT (NUDIX family)
MAKNQQVAALPWRRGEHGVEILLVTTRTTKRWLIPKGWIMDGKADHEAAAIEAFEEAGVLGVIESSPVGIYRYMKILRSGKARPVKVKVYCLAVQEVLQNWPECAERERRWLPLQQASKMIGEPELLPVVQKFAARNTSVLGFLKTWWTRLLG